METRRSCKLRKWAGSSSLLLVLWATATVVPGVRAGAPDWLKAAARETLPSYAEDVDMVILLDEQVTTVSGSGEIKTRHRRAMRILRPQGREHGQVQVDFDNDTRLTYLKAWCVPATGAEYEVKEGDAVEVSHFGISLYADNRAKVLTIPAADPGNTIGYEYEQRQRPYLLQSMWFFQDTHPLRRGRYALELPSGWEFDAVMVNHPDLEPTASGTNLWVWELRDIPEVTLEPQMPAWESVAGRLVINLYPPNQRLRAKAHRSWAELANWYLQLAAERRQATPEIKQKVAELTAGASSKLEQIRALARFVQRDIRYVSIAIGIGGYQPNHARDIFSNRYGDCKDKATLLSTMLKEIGVESYYVFINTERGRIWPEHPPAIYFNHAILAIRLPEEVEAASLSAVLSHDRQGKLLFFDPTDEYVPLGQLPDGLQANYGLLALEDGGEFVRLPLLPPATSRLLRVARLKLNDTGGLSGEVQEVRWGLPAVARRVDWLGQPAAERKKSLESFLGGFLTGGFTLQNAEVENLEKLDDSLVVHYTFQAPNYARRAGDLLLVRPRVLGAKTSDVLERRNRAGQGRHYPVELGNPELHSDLYEIELPSGYQVDELPPPVEVDFDFASYKSAVEVEGKLIRYKREYVVKDVQVSTERLEQLKEFYRRIAADERASVVLKRVAH